MDFLSSLSKAAEASGMKEVQGAIAPTVSVKADNVASFGALLGAAKVVAPPAPPTPILSAGVTNLDELGDVDTWSFSTLKAFEGCQYAVKLDKVDKIKQESGEAAERGSLIHDGCENWVRGDVAELPSDGKTRFEYFMPDFDMLQSAFADGRVLMEENWGIRKDWSPCSWDPKNPEANDPELWGKAKLDVFLIETSILKAGVEGYVAFGEDGSLELRIGDDVTPWDDVPMDVKAHYAVTCRIIDYKTGKKFGNEMKHSDQGLSYALHTMHRYPDINAFEIEFWYIDQADKLKRLFNRRQLLMLLRMYHTRALKLTSCTNFMPAPNAHNCVYCPYGANQSKAGKKYGNAVCQYDHYKGYGEDE